METTVTTGITDFAELARSMAQQVFSTMIGLQLEKV